LSNRLDPESGTDEIICFTAVAGEVEGNPDTGKVPDVGVNVLQGSVSSGGVSLFNFILEPLRSLGAIGHDGLYTALLESRFTLIGADFRCIAETLELFFVIVEKSLNDSHRVFTPGFVRAA